MEAIYQYCHSKTTEIRSQYAALTADERRKQYETKLEEAVELLLADITKNHEERLRKTAESGQFVLSLYDYDVDDVHTTYNGFVVKDIVRKSNLIQRLKEFFHPFAVSVSRKSQTKYVINVYWGDISESTPLQPEEKEQPQIQRQVASAARNPVRTSGEKQQIRGSYVGRGGKSYPNAQRGRLVEKAPTWQKPGQPLRVMPRLSPQTQVKVQIQSDYTG
jgi:hypothetical protein